MRRLLGSRYACAEPAAQGVRRGSHPPSQPGRAPQVGRDIWRGGRAPGEEAFRPGQYIPPALPAGSPEFPVLNPHGARGGVRGAVGLPLKDAARLRRRVVGVRTVRRGSFRDGAFGGRDGCWSPRLARTLSRISGVKTGGGWEAPGAP